MFIYLITEGDHLLIWLRAIAFCGLSVHIPSPVFLLDYYQFTYFADFSIVSGIFLITLWDVFSFHEC